MYTVKELRMIAKHAGVNAEIIREGSGIAKVWVKSENDANIYNQALKNCGYELHREPMAFTNFVTPSTIKFVVIGKVGA